MVDLGKAVQYANRELHVGWTDARAVVVRRELDQRVRARKAQKRLVVIAAPLALAASVMGLWVGRRWTSPGASVATSVAANAVAGSFALRDGSTMKLLQKDTVVRDLSSEGQTEIELVSGSVHFEVVHNPGRLFRVRAGEIVVEDIGTVFDLRRTSSGAHVSVQSGNVRVRAADRTVELSAGAEQDFSGRPASSLDAAGRAVESDAPAPPDRVGAEHDVFPGTPQKGPTWRTLARDADFSSAYKLLHARGEQVRDEPADLLLAADVARLSHHPAEALPPLRKLVARHAHDARAPSAAFTEGRVLLEELGSYRAAALAFAQARALEPTGPLAEDALAREVEAWSKVGDVLLAQQRAAEYVRRYPNGRKVNAVRAHAALP